MSPFLHTLGVAVRKDMSAVMRLDHSHSTTHIAWLARVTPRMPVDGANLVARLKARWGVDRQRRGRASSLEPSDILSPEDAFSRFRVREPSGLSRRQFLCG